MTKNTHDAVAIAKARSVLARWNVVDPKDIDLNDFASDLNVVILERDRIGSAARIVSLGNSGIITVNSEIQENGRKRFAIAHELGHFLLHKKKNPVALCKEANFFQWHKASLNEIEANAFAVELLMPSELFKDQSARKDPSLRGIAELAELFQTSLTATAIRYVELGGAACAVIASEDSTVKWFTVSSSFPYRIIKPGTKLDPYSCAGEFFEKRVVPTDTETVPGYAWLEDQRIGRKCYLYEDLIALTKYNSTLSLIWVRQDNSRINEIEVDEHFTPDGKRYRW